MTRILALDTSSEACSVALLDQGQLSEDFRMAPREHTRLLLPMVDGLLQQAQLKLSDLDALAFGCGPGSFTGLRIAAGMVQGLAWGADLPVVAVSTPAAMAYDAAQSLATSQILVLIDARMDEVYAGLYEIQGESVTPLAAERVCAPERLDDVLPLLNGPVAVVGSGLGYEERFPQALRALIQARDPDLQPRAGAVARLGLQQWLRGEQLRPDQVQPVYLRDEVAWNKLPGR